MNEFWHQKLFFLPVAFHYFEDVDETPQNHYSKARVFFIFKFLIHGHRNSASNMTNNKMQ